MSWDDFIHAVRYEHFTEADSVVYHFRISTQAGVNPEMTHPFPLTNHIEQCKLLDCGCPIGVAHNGIIQMTSNSRDKEYSDTAHFIAEFMCYMIRNQEDMRNPAILEAIERMTWCKFALMDSSGYIATIGHFTEEDGTLYSNGSYRPPERKRYDHTPPRRRVIRGFYDETEFDY